MGWLRLVGCLKIQVSFAKELYKRDLYSAKRLVFLSILLIVATPYIIIALKKVYTELRGGEDQWNALSL